MARVNPANSFWRHTHMAKHGPGKSPGFNDPEVLRKAIVEYFDHIESNPYLEEENTFYKGKQVKGTKAKALPFTNRGMCAFIGISRDTWKAWRSERPELEQVIKWADEVVYNQKFSLAANGQFNTGLIQRDLGLVDKIESSQTTVVIEQDDADL
jgi:hypothetical protein